MLNTLNKKFALLKIIWILVLFAGKLEGQNLEWKGTAANHDFFDESNWVLENTSQTPLPGTIDPGKEINMNLKITGADSVVAAGIISPGSGSLTLDKTAVKAEGIGNGRILLNEDTYLELNTGAPFAPGASVELASAIAWVSLPAVKPRSVSENMLPVLTVNNQPAIYPDNIRIDNYYSSGSIVRMENSTTAPLTLYDEPDLTGNSVKITINQVHSGSEIAGGMNNNLSSFLLKRGFMVTMAVNDDGTGLSKVFIAAEEDLKIDRLSAGLDNQISFIRVVPWNWASKKGIGGQLTGLNESWNYAWNNTGQSTIDREYVPMAWGKGGADDQSDIDLYRNKYKATHVLAFNESDNCNDQSGQWGNLCNTDVAVDTYKNLMKTGLRLVSPSCRENAPFGWLLEFYEKATALDIRVDVIGVHWYDWGSNPAGSPNADPQQVFNRFKNYLQRVYDLYHLPIWITEFNANPNRTASVNNEFMKLALPYLEKLDYVERYAWFEPNSGVADYFDEQNNLTETGSVYLGMKSDPSISKKSWAAPNNLDEKILVTVQELPVSPREALVYPVPVKDKLWLDRLGQFSELSVSNNNGSVILKAFYQPHIDVSWLHPGLYILSAGNLRLKFIKQ